jgi:hypothetical protein
MFARPVRQQRNAYGLNSCSYCDFSIRFLEIVPDHNPRPVSRYTQSEKSEDQRGQTVAAVKRDATTENKIKKQRYMDRPN